jgi:hypothetical protein
MLGLSGGDYISVKPAFHFQLKQDNRNRVALNSLAGRHREARDRESQGYRLRIHGAAWAREMAEVPLRKHRQNADHRTARTSA